MATGVQRQDVFDVSDALIREGLRPTIERVRQKLGRGSPNTVSPMLDEWFKTLGPRLGGLAPADGTPPAVAAIAGKLWAAALNEARKELVPLQQELQGTQEKFSALELASETKAQAAQDQLAQLTQTLAQNEQQLAASQEKEQATQALAATLAQDVRASHAAAQALQQTLDSARLAAQAERATLVEQHTVAQRHWALETDRARQALALQEMQSAQALQEHRTSAEQALARAAEELREAQAELAASQSTLVATRDSLREQTGQVQVLQGQLAAYQAALEAQERKVSWLKNAGDEVAVARRVPRPLRPVPRAGRGVR